MTTPDSLLRLLRKERAHMRTLAALGLNASQSLALLTHRAIALAQSDGGAAGVALDALFDAVYAEGRAWTPEKVALTLKLQRAYPARPWKKLLAPVFRSSPPDLLSTGNLSTLARILKVHLRLRLRLAHGRPSLT